MGTRILDFRFGLVDLEGVIFNPGILYRREFGRFLQQRYQIAAKDALRFYQAHETLPLEAKFARLLAQHGHSPEGAAEVATAFRMGVAATRPVVSEGARELGETLVARGARLFALCETESGVAARKLDEAELHGLFEQVIGSERALGWGAQIALCADAVGVPLEAFAAQSFVLASRPEDVTTAAEFGCYAVGIAHLFPETALKAHGAREVYRHITHLALHLRHG
ncbi:MAG: hypothetical protein ACE5IQ_04875 [Candidatus Methylomirabilales bacterium]